MSTSTNVMGGSGQGGGSLSKDAAAAAAAAAAASKTTKKTRMGVVLRESLGGNKSSSKSADLLALTERYTAWTKKMASMIESIQQHHAAMMQLEATRVAVRVYIVYCKRENDCLLRSFSTLYIHPILTHAHSHPPYIFIMSFRW